MVAAAQREQFLVGAVFHDAAALQHQDAVGHPRRGQAVGDDDGGAVGGDRHEPFVYRLLLQRVDRRRRFVEQDGVVAPEQPARDGQPLPLAKGQIAGSELSRQHHVQAVWALPQLLRHAAVAQRAEHLRFRSRGRHVGQNDVVAQGHLIAMEVLEHRRGVGAHLLLGRAPGIDAAADHLPAARHVQPQQQLGQRGLAGAVDAHQGQGRPLIERQGHPAHRLPCAARIAEPHLARGQLAGRGRGAGAAGALRPALVETQKLNQVGGRGAGGVGGAEHVHHRLGHQQQPAHRVDHHRESADADTPVGQQPSRQQERSPVTEQHQHAQAQIDRPQAAIFAPPHGVEAAHRAAVALQQARAGAQHPGLLEVLAVHQAALQVLELAQQRHGLAFELVVPAAAHEVAHDPRHEHQRNHQRQQRRQEIEVRRRHDEEGQLVDREHEEQHHRDRGVRAPLRQLQPLVRGQRLELDRFQPGGLGVQRLGQDAGPLAAEVDGEGIGQHLQQFPQQHDRADEENGAGQLLYPPEVGDL